MANRRPAIRGQKTAWSATAVPNFRIRRSEVLSAQPKSQQPPWLPSADGDAYAPGILLACFAVGLFLVWRGSYTRFFYAPNGPTGRRSTRRIDQGEPIASPPGSIRWAMVTPGV